MDSRRVCQVALTTGLLVLTACGEPPPRIATVSIDVEARQRRIGPAPTPTGNVRDAITALAHARDRWIGAIPPPTTVPAVTVAPDVAQTIASTTPPLATTSWPSSYQPCGGAYPPCSVVEIESGGDYGAFNPDGCGGSGCFGKWQFSGEWACRLGLPCDLAAATPAQQDEAARILWAGGAGCSNWAAC